MLKPWLVWRINLLQWYILPLFLCLRTFFPEDVSEISSLAAPMPFSSLCLLTILSRVPGVSMKLPTLLTLSGGFFINWSWTKNVGKWHIGMESFEMSLDLSRALSSNTCAFFALSLSTHGSCWVLVFLNFEIFFEIFLSPLKESFSFSQKLWRRMESWVC